MKRVEQTFRTESGIVYTVGLDVKSAHEDERVVSNTILMAMRHAIHEEAKLFGDEFLHRREFDVPEGEKQ